MRHSVLVRRAQTVLQQSSSSGRLTLLLAKCGVAAGSIVALKLTYNVLSADQFVDFNFLLLCFSLSAVVTVPFSRKIWIENSNASAVSALLPGTLLVVLVYAAALSLVAATMGRGYIGGQWIFFLTLPYVIAKNIERSFYNIYVTRRSYYLGMTFSIFFLLLEIAAAVIGGAFPGNELAMRILLPSLFFPVFAYVISDIRFAEFHPNKILSSIWEEVFSNGSYRVVFLYLLMVAVVMVDRYGLITFANRPLVASSVSTKDALLVVAYGISFSTFLQVLLDWYRSAAFLEGEPTQDAWREALKTCVIYLSLGSAAVISFPVLKMVGILPPQVGLFLWSMIILRFAVIGCIMIFTADLTLAGTVTFRPLTSWAVYLPLSLGSYLVVFPHFGLDYTSAVILALAVAIAVLELISFQRRMRRV